MNRKTLSLIYILILVMTCTVKANNGTQEVSTRWKTLNELITKEEKTIKQLGRLGPKLQYRMLELKSEKIKLLIEKENEMFLSQRDKKHKKSWYFRKSTKLYKYVRKMGLDLIKKYPKFNKISRIYYTLALNERDYGNDKKTEYYLKLALNNANKKDKIIHNAKTSLAEYYYNNKKYKLAVKYYKDVVTNKKDDWYTRHLFNHAWCLLKTNQMELAISNMKVSFKDSSNPKYISMKDQILESFVVFFVHGNKIKEGIIFYKDNVTDPTDYLISMAKKTAQKGLYKETKAVIKAALVKAKELGRQDKVTEIHLNELDIYRNFKDFDLYFKTAKKINALNSLHKIDLDTKNEIVQKISSLVGYLQVRLSKNLKLNNKVYDKQKLDEIISYFKILSNLDKDNKDKYYYYIGETYYSISKFKSAASAYTESITSNMNKKNRMTQALQRKIFKSFLALLGSTSFDQNLQFKNTIFVYERHLKIWPVHKMSKLIYSRLFNLYIDQKKIDQAIIVFNKYKLNYKKELTHQKALYTKIMDFYIQIKDTENLSINIAKIQTGFLNFKKSYIEKSMAILGSLLFNKYQLNEDKGQSEIAIAGYKKLFEDDRYPNKIQAQSAFKAALIYLKLSNTTLSYDWIIKSLQKHTFKDNIALLPKLEIISKEFGYLQDFKNSSILSNLILNRFCKVEFKEKISLYSLSVYHQLIENNYKAALISFKLGKKCNISTTQIVKNAKNIIQFLKENRLYKQYFSFYESTKKSSIFKHISNHFVSSFFEIYWDSKNSKSIRLSSKIKKILLSSEKKGSLTKDQLLMISNIKEFDDFIAYSNNLNLSLKGNKIKFNEKRFNSSLTKSLKKLENFSTKAEGLLVGGHKELILGTYIILNEKYDLLISNILEFKPKSMPNDFLKGFTNAMLTLTNNLKNKSQSYRLNANQVIFKNDILSYQNFIFLHDHKFMGNINYRYPASKLISTSDTEGVIR